MISPVILPSGWPTNKHYRQTPRKRTSCPAAFEQRAREIAWLIEISFDSEMEEKDEEMEEEKDPMEYFWEDEDDAST